MNQKLDFDNQDRWNEKGAAFLKELKDNPEKFIIDLPLEKFTNSDTWIDYSRELGDILEKDVLEVGCGRGEFSVYLAKQRAKLTAIDIGKDLINSAKELSDVNKTEIKFVCCSSTNMPFAKESLTL